MEIPGELIHSLEHVQGFDKESFLHAHQSGDAATSVRVNPAKISRLKTDLISQLPITEKIPWTSNGYYLNHRPSFTFDPLFHAGLYYVQEASSMFLEQVLKQSKDLSEPVKVLDLCAAPGGKSTLIASLISGDSLLVSNEVIQSRATVLVENMTKWATSNTIITNNDPAAFQKLQSFFDIVVVDAPCSGSGLFRKDPDAIEEWSESNVQLCSQRQQRILADIYPALKKDGILIYSTCSYSEEENECISDWLLDSFPLSTIQISLTDTGTGREYDGVIETISKKHAAFGYRFFPGKVKGEGFFIAAFRKTYGDAVLHRPPKKIKIERVSKNEEAIVKPWLINEPDVQLWRQGDLIFAFPSHLEKELLTVISSDLYIRLAGIQIGSIAGKDLVPEHGFALSSLIRPDIVSVPLKKDEALQYLRKEEVKTMLPHRGWAIVQYEGMNLGWIKLLGNRTNNYYPREWRILKSGNQ